MQALSGLRYMALHPSLTDFTPTLVIGRRSMLPGFTLGALNFRSNLAIPLHKWNTRGAPVPWRGFTQMLHDLSAFISCAVCRANLKPF